MHSEHVAILSDSDVVEIVFLEVILSSLLPVVADDSLHKTLFDDSISYSLESHEAEILLDVIVPHSRVFLAFIKTVDFAKVESKVKVLNDIRQFFLDGWEDFEALFFGQT